MVVCNGFRKRIVIDAVEYLGKMKSRNRLAAIIVVPHPKHGCNDFMAPLVP